MNKIYKVVFNAAKGAFVVVSELAKSNTKSTVGKKGSAKLSLNAVMVAILLTAPAFMAGVSNVNAETVNSETVKAQTVNSQNVEAKAADTENKEKEIINKLALKNVRITSGGNVVLGDGNNVGSYKPSLIGDNNTVKANAVNIFGDNNVLTARDATVIGNHNKSNGEDEIIFGSYNTTSPHSDSGEDQNITIGSYNKTTAGSKNMILGYNNDVRNASYLSIIGNHNKIATTGYGATGMFDHSEVKASSAYLFGSFFKIKGEAATAFGYQVEVTEGSDNVIIMGQFSKTGWRASESVIIGNYAEVGTPGGVAIGYMSYSDRGDTGQIGRFSNYNLKGQLSGAFSVGRAGVLRQVINVADGTEDTDAVNVRQLQAVADMITDANTPTPQADKEKNYWHVNATGVFGDATTTQGTTNLDDVGKEGGAIGIDSMAAGKNAQAKGESSIALGLGAKADADGSLVIGEGSTAQGVNLGNNSFGGAKNAIVVGNGAVAEGELQANGTVVGAKNTIVVGQDAKAEKDAQNSVVIGANAVGSSLSSVTIGDAATTNGADNDIAIGHEAATTGQKAVALGFQSKAASQAVAVGPLAQAIGTQSTVFGHRSYADKIGAAAIGVQSRATGEYAAAFGATAKASGKFSAAVGPASNATAENSGAYGPFAKANHENSVALGSFSETVAAVSVEDATIGGLKLTDFAGNTKGTDSEVEGVISIGNVNGGTEYTRQIKHLAPGEISATSTDAINGSQLFVTNQLVDNIASSLKTDVLGGNATYDNTGKFTMSNVGDTGEATIHDAIKHNKEEIEKIDVEGSINNVIGDYAKKDASNITGADKVAWQTVLGDGAVAAGNVGLINGNTLFNEVRVPVLTDGSKYNYISAGNTAAQNIADLDEKVGENAESIKSITGDVTNIQGDITNIDNRVTKTEGDITKIQGDITNISNSVKDKADTDLGNITDDGKEVIQDIAKDAVIVEAAKGSAISVTDSIDTDGNKHYEIDVDLSGVVAGGVNVGYKAEGDANKQDVSLADGFVFAGDDNITASVDAGGKVQYGLNKDITGINSIKLEDAGNVTIGKTVIEDGKISGIDTDSIVDGSDVVNKEYVDNSVGEISSNIANEVTNNINNSIQEVRSEMAGIGAHSAALAALKPLQYRPYEKTQIMAGVGRYKNANSFALGLAVHSNEDLMLNGGIAFGSGQTMMMNAGVTWRVGTKGAQDLPEILQEGPITAVEKLVEQVDSLNTQLASYEDRFEAQEAQNKRLEEKNQQLEEQIQMIMETIAAK